MFDSIKKKQRVIHESAKEFFQYVEKPPSFNSKKVFDFKKSKGKKSFKSEGLKL